MILLSTLLRNNWKTIQLDYILYFTEEPVDRERYMNIPKGIEVQIEIEWLLKSKKKAYGQHQPGRVWNKLLVEH